MEDINDLLNEIDFKITSIIKEVPIDMVSKIPHGRIGCIGIYILNFESGNRYIGRSINIRNRINDHKRNIRWRSEKIVTVTVLIVELMNHAKILEEILIRNLNPEYNSIFRIG